VPGTFSGRYVDVDERGDLTGKRTAEGALWSRASKTVVAASCGIT
jgi:hypothetical protein